MRKSMAEREGKLRKCWIKDMQEDLRRMRIQGHGWSEVPRSTGV
jgi:hypothetical protein